MDINDSWAGAIVSVLGAIGLGGAWMGRLQAKVSSNTKRIDECEEGHLQRVQDEHKVHERLAKLEVTIPHIDMNLDLIARKLEKKDD
jgi:hypothetical protein